MHRSGHRNHPAATAAARMGENVGGEDRRDGFTLKKVLLKIKKGNSKGKGGDFFSLKQKKDTA